MTAKRVTIIMVVILAFYGLVAVSQAITLITSGDAAAIGVGVGLLILPLILIWVVWRELSFGVGVQNMARQLELEGGLPVDDLPRTAGGRVDREAADAAFDEAEVAAQADPTDWRAWFRLAASYDAASDRKRARAAMRYALALYQGKDPGSASELTSAS